MKCNEERATTCTADVQDLGEEVAWKAQSESKTGIRALSTHCGETEIDTRTSISHHTIEPPYYTGPNTSRRTTHLRGRPSFYFHALSLTGYAADCQMSSQLCRRAYTLPPRAVRGLVLPCARVPDEFHFRGRGKGDERDGRARRGITAGREWAGRSRTARDGRVGRGRGRRKTVHVRSGSSSQGGESRAASRVREWDGRM